MNRDYKEAFFSRSTPLVAKSLLGAKLTTWSGGLKTSGMIVEVEAYREKGDLASHAYRGPTKRNAIMFKEGGHCYTYLIYGIHHCVNVVTEGKNFGAAVLIRAVEPIHGTSVMVKRRKSSKQIALTNGPGKLCKAFGIDLSFSGEHLLVSKKIRLSPYRRIRKKDIGISTRIGISKSKDLPWRFYIRGNPWVSKNR